jgi:hypothetical protein
VYKTKKIILAGIILITMLLSACSNKTGSEDVDLGQNNDNNKTDIIRIEGPLAREDFNFHDGSKMIDADDEEIYGGTVLSEGLSTARGFKYGDDLQKFAQLYDGLPCIITVTSAESEVTYYPDSEITGVVTDITEENCISVNFLFIFNGYTLSFDYATNNKKFEVTAHSVQDNSRFQAFSLIISIAQYRQFGPYPDIWPYTGHLPWAEVVDEIGYLNARDDILNEEEQVFVFEHGEKYMENYSIPPVLEEQREYLTSLTESEKNTFDGLGLKIWDLVQTNLIKGE